MASIEAIIAALSEASIAEDFQKSVLQNKATIRIAMIRVIEEKAYDNVYTYPASSYFMGTRRYGFARNDSGYHLKNVAVSGLTANLDIYSTHTKQNLWGEYSNRYLMDTGDGRWLWGNYAGKLIDMVEEGFHPSVRPWLSMPARPFMKEAETEIASRDVVGSLIAASMDGLIQARLG